MIIDLLCILVCSFFYSSTQPARSVLRPTNIATPQLIARWTDDQANKTYSITDSHIEEYPLFVVFDRQHFDQNKLPQGLITFRNEPEQSVSSDILNQLIEGLLEELACHKNTYQDFILLQDKNFNHLSVAGLAVFKFKAYPFVLKLFIEEPESFVNPWMKGAETVWFFYMGGGANRHITGLTRIKNKLIIQDQLKQHPKWKDFVDTPRQWFWTPKNLRWIELTGKNIGDKKTIKARIPGTYALIADAITPTTEKTIFDQNKTKIALEICNTLDLYIDPHIDNFMVEHKTNKLVIIDTEHFPTMVGLKEKMSFRSYTSWYIGLACKAGFDMYFRNKKYRALAQVTPSKLGLFP